MEIEMKTALALITRAVQHQQDLQNPNLDGDVTNDFMKDVALTCSDVRSEAVLITALAHMGAALTSIASKCGEMDEMTLLRIIGMDLAEQEFANE